LLIGNYLFFGCRNKDKDFFCGDEWKRYEGSSLMKLFVAFSRDQVNELFVVMHCVKHSRDQQASAFLVLEL